MKKKSEWLACIDPRFERREWTCNTCGNLYVQARNVKVAKTEAA